MPSRLHKGFNGLAGGELERRITAVVVIGCGHSPLADSPPSMAGYHGTFPFPWVGVMHNSTRQRGKPNGNFRNLTKAASVTMPWG